MAIQTEGRLANCGTREQRLLAAQLRAECTDLREPGRENAVAIERRAVQRKKFLNCRRRLIYHYFHDAKSP